jgi:glycosyltransferase involved in cell wall biosynthesis
MRVVAIVASYNEEIFIEACLENYLRQGVEVYLLDNESTDRTVEIARQYLGKNLVTIETIERRGHFEWTRILKRKEQIAGEIAADWFLHADVDEIRLPPRSDTTLAAAIEEADRQGYNAINFMEFTFLPTIESPDHMHRDFQKTMRWYYPYAPFHPNRVNGWKRQPPMSPAARWRFFRRTHRLSDLRPRSVDIAGSGGHRVAFDGLRLYPVDFKMRHYLALSLAHAVRKYVKKDFDPREVASGSHGWRAWAKENDLRLPSESEMRLYTGDDGLDASEPLEEHILVKVSR